MHCHRNPSNKTPGEIGQFIFGMMRYLLLTGAQLRDGQTLGFGEQEKVDARVIYGTSQVPNMKTAVTRLILS